MKSVTGKPILFASTGEKLDALEVFHPDRMASRILGMGDVLTLIERAEQAASADEQAEMEARMRKGQFTFDDFLQAQRMLRRMGPLQGVMKMIPGMGAARRPRRRRGAAEARRGDRPLDDPARARRPARDRRQPPRADRARIGHERRASVNKLLEARKMMERMMKQMGYGKMPSLPGLGGLGGGCPACPAGPPARPAVRRSKKKKSKRKTGRR